MRLAFVDSQLPAWMKKPDAEADDAAERDEADEVISDEVISDESDEVVVVLPTLGALPEPLGPPIVETEEEEAPEALESPKH